MHHAQQQARSSDTYARSKSCNPEPMALPSVYPHAWVRAWHCASRDEWDTVTPTVLPSLLVLYCKISRKKNNNVYLCSYTRQGGWGLLSGSSWSHLSLSLHRGCQGTWTVLQDSSAHSCILTACILGRTVRDDMTTKVLYDSMYTWGRGNKENTQPKKY